MVDFAGGHVPNAGLRGEIYGEQQIADLFSLFRDVGFDTVWFRTSFCGKVCYPSKVMQPFDGEYRLFVNHALKEIMARFDPLEVVVREARRCGLKLLCWITPMDNYYPGIEDPVLARHPEWLLQSRDGRYAMRGLPCLGCTEYVDLRVEEVREVMAYGCDGVFHGWSTHTVDASAEGDPEDLPDNFGWNPPILEAYDAKHGKPARPEEYDPDLVYQVHSDFLDAFVRRSGEAVHEKQGEYVTSSVSSVLTTDDYSWYIYRPGGARVFRLPSRWRMWAEEGWIDRVVAGAGGGWLEENEKAAPFPVPGIGHTHAAWGGDPHHPEMADVADADFLALVDRCLTGPLDGVAIQESDSIEAGNPALWDKLTAAWRNGT